LPLKLPFRGNDKFAYLDDGRPLEGKVTLVIGAGASIEAGAPAMKDVNEKLSEALEVNSSGVEGVQELLRSSPSHLVEFCRWLTNSLDVIPTWAYSIFALAAVTQTVDLTITTNWDLLLERQIEWLYQIGKDRDYFNVSPEQLRQYPGAPYSSCWDAGDYYEIELGKGLRVVFTDNDLANVHGSETIIYKLHGSPFHLYCPKCVGSSRWKKVPSGVSFAEARCSIHRHQKLDFQVVLPNEGIDRANPLVYEYVEEQIKQSEVVLCVGYSGRDYYLRNLLEGHPNIWVYTPSPAFWNTGKVKWVKATATDLAKSLSSFIPFHFAP